MTPRHQSLPLAGHVWEMYILERERERERERETDRQTDRQTDSLQVPTAAVLYVAFFLPLAAGFRVQASVWRYGARRDPNAGLSIRSEFVCPLYIDAVDVILALCVLFEGVDKAAKPCSEKYFLMRRTAD